MTTTTGLRRLGVVVIALITAGITILAATSYFISASTVPQQAIQEIRAVTGLNTVLRGETTVSLLSAGTISFGEVILGDIEHPALTARRLTARLRFFPLLMGRVEIADIALEQPTITIDVEPNGKSNWSGFIEGLARSQKPETVQATRAFSEMRIEKGVVVLRDRARQIFETFHELDFSLAWPSISKSFGATGRFVWRGKPMDARLTLTDFQAALTGVQSGLKLRLASEHLNAALDGTMSISPTLKLEGALAAETYSLRDALIWAGHQALPEGGFGHFAIKAKANVIGGTIGLAGVNLELDGNSAEGALTFINEGRKILQGTLATTMLDLSPYVSAVHLLTGNQRAWNNEQINAEGLNGMDIDLRLSAAKVVVSKAQLGRTAIGANLHGGRLVVTIGEAEAYEGVIQGSLTVANFEQGVAVTSRLQFTGVDLQTCLSQLFGVRQLEGKGDISLNVAGTGKSVLALTSTLNGTAILTGEKGALSGLDIEKLLRRLERRPLSGGGDFRNGRTPYEKITVSLKVDNGTIRVDDVRLDGSAVKLSIGGSASVPARNLDLKGSAALVESSSTAPAFELPFVVQGSWDDPIMLPDAEALIQRSGAAAPLLRAIRNRGPSDKIQSVIEKLTGSPKNAPPAAEPGPVSAPSAR